MRCPQCASTQIQRDYDDARALVRLAGMRKVLCNTCGHVFHGFDPLGRIRRSPGKRIEWSNRRVAPRYTAHLPTAISLVETTSKDGKATYSEPSKGHCESISSHGMGLSLIGSRFPEQELSRKGRLLFVRVDLPLATIEAVVSVVNPRRIGEHQRKWFLGVRIQQIAETDKANLRAYLEQRTKDQPLPISE
jgi:PilZ domain-containing protein